MNEVWKTVPNFPCYEVSSQGKVRVLDRVVTRMHPKYNTEYSFVKKGKEISPRNNGNGYLWVTFYAESGQTKHWYIHRLVHHVFIAPITTGMEINHLDGNRANNSVFNLEAVTHQDNILYKQILGTQTSGDGHPGTKLTSAQVLEIKQRYTPRCKVNGAIALGKEFGVSHATISRAVSGACWGHLDG